MWGVRLSLLSVAVAAVVVAVPFGLAPLATAAAEAPMRTGSQASTQSQLAAAVTSAVADYAAHRYNPSLNFAHYDPQGSYLAYEKTKNLLGRDYPADAAGVPVMATRGAAHYNAVQVAQFALAEHGLLVADEGARATSFHERRFKAAIERLLAMQSDDGAFRYSFSWRYYLNGQTFAPGWVSALAQGQAISALVRAYGLERDPRYLDAARRAYKFLQVPVGDGGVRTSLKALNANLADYVFYDEYVAQPSGFTLNGFLFTMLGIWDWCSLTTGLGLSAEAATCRADFEGTLRTLTRILRYYDLGSFSAYDLGHLTYRRAIPHIASRYHSVHIYLLHAIVSITNSDTVRHYENTFSTYVSPAALADAQSVISQSGP